MPPVKVARAEDVAEGAGRPFLVDGRPVAVFRVGGRLYALEGTCPHRGGPLGEGTLQGNVLTCPWHGWRFEVDTGKCLVVPDRTQPCYPVREEGGEIVVDA